MSRRLRPRRLVVDGEEFLVKPRPDGSGTMDCDWLSGPNSGYGLSVARPAHSREGTSELPAGLDVTDAILIEAIREFLSDVDPNTGYIE